MEYKGAISEQCVGGGRCDAMEVCVTRSRCSISSHGILNVELLNAVQLAIVGSCSSVTIPILIASCKCN